MAERDAHTTGLAIRAPKELLEALKVTAFATGRSINEIVIDALLEYLSAHGHRETVDALLERVREHYRSALDDLASL
jgi:DNA-binding transcriptional MocR family regulator